MSAGVITPVEQTFLALPGGGSPIGRMIISGGAGAAVAYFVRPSVSFDANGNARPWILFDSKNSDATIFPYWAWFVVPAVTFGLFL